jgi:hypothetical protein
LSFLLPSGQVVGWANLSPAWAGPVDWHEVPATSTARQWWDAGSLRRNRRGTLSVLSRFQAISPQDEASSPDSSPDALVEGATAPAKPARSPLGTLVVMELDCDQELYRDVAVNGLPRFNAPWQPTGGDSLVTATLREACAAASAANLGTAPIR